MVYKQDLHLSPYKSRYS